MSHRHRNAYGKALDNPEPNRAPLKHYEKRECDPDRDLWCQQSWETDRMYGLFTIYRDLGRLRDMPTVADMSGLKETYLRNRMSVHRWIERAKAWDDEQDRIYGVRVTHMRQEMARRHVKAAQGLMDKALRRLAELDLDHISPNVLVLMLDTAARIERAALGLEAGQKSETTIAAVSVTSRSAAGTGEVAQEMRVEVGVLHEQVMSSIHGLVQKLSPEQIAEGYRAIAADAATVEGELAAILPADPTPAG